METGFIILITTAALIAGVLTGLLISKFVKKPEETQGTIYAYYSEQDNMPSLLLEYSVPIDDIASRKRVLFDVTVIR